MSQDTPPFYDTPETAPAQAPSSERDEWDVALVCLNSHLVNNRCRDEPAKNASECPVCGAETLSRCPGCREPVPGLFTAAAVAGAPARPREAPSVQRVPRFCPACGRPYPWTERTMSAARTVIRELGALDSYERDQLRRSIDHIIRETPQTDDAIRRINNALSRLGGEPAAALRALLVSVAAEAVRRRLFAGDPEPEH